MTSNDKGAAKKKKAQRTPASSANGKGNQQRGSKAGSQRSTKGKAASGKAGGDKADRKGVHGLRGSARRAAGRSKGTLQQGARYTPRVQREERGAVVLSVAVFLLCMACLAAGYFLSSYTPQSTKGIIDAWQPLVDQGNSSQTAQESLSLPITPTLVEDTTEDALSPVATAQTNGEDSLAPDAKESATGTAGTPDETDTLAPEEPPAPQAKAADGGTQVKQSAARQNEKALSPAKADKGVKFGIPPAKNGAVLVFIIDDGGYSTAHLEKYTGLPFPLAVAVLPRLAHSVQCAQIVRSSGQELMLHQPMQAKNLKLNPGDGAVLPNMSLSEVYDTVTKNLREIGPVRGMNNHEGSLITADAPKIAAVLDAAKAAGVYFLDSRTSADTVVPAVARERGMRILQRDVFIDDVISEDEMLKQILRGLEIANKKGQVVMIGHVDKSAAILPSLLKRMHPELVKQGYAFAFPSELLR